MGKKGHCMNTAWAGLSNQGHACFLKIYPEILKDKKIDCLRFVMCPLLVPGFQGFFFYAAVNRVLMKQTRQALRAIK